MDEYEEWDAGAAENASEFDSFPEEFLRVADSGDAEDAALWDDAEAEPDDKPQPDAREKDVFEIEQDAVEASLDLYGETDDNDEEPQYDSLKKHPIYQTLLEQNRASAKRRLIRELKEDALARIEFAARSVRDYEQVLQFWDKKDDAAARRQRQHEDLRGDTPIEWKTSLTNSSGIDMTFPAWMSDPTFSQLRRGIFLDYLFDCPYEMHDLTAKEYLRRPVMELKEEHKEILHFLYLRLYDPQRLALLRGQTDRNIRKVRDVALRKIRRRVYASLQRQQLAGKKLTPRERAFLEEFTQDGVKRKDGVGCA